ncbi:hypothetical protein EYF80_068256 [Liparis tanakae]|uniref:Uncharacterized protein n=1 Tax=Liparis tanakae TaxID=230148 RepID=A0A4Z2DZQ4_9TELE|nr:hypothetical protein EYF80_068256 [Liparis tanakae]
MFSMQENPWCLCGGGGVATPPTWACFDIYLDVGGDPNRPLKRIVSDIEEPQQAA